MESILDQYISVYRNNKDNAGALTRISNFLNSTRHRDEILRLRTITDKKQRDAAKMRLPLATISGVFQPTRSLDNLKQHSGFICIDIDHKDNTHISLEHIRHILANRPEVCYASLSVSGLGYFALIRLAQPKYHVQHFRQLMKDYADIGIVLDKACSDVCRLRCVSFDDHPYINLGATIYQGLHKETMPQNMRPPAVGITDDLRKVQRCCDKIAQHHIDITDLYDDWFLVGSALSSMGEDGRYFFHLCSSQSPKYSREQTDKKFDECLRNTKSIGLGSFFYLCQQYGVSYCNR